MKLCSEYDMKLTELLAHIIKDCLDPQLRGVCCAVENGGSTTITETGYIRLTI